MPAKREEDICDCVGGVTFGSKNLTLSFFIFYIFYYLNGLKHYKHSYIYLD